MYQLVIHPDLRLRYVCQPVITIDDAVKKEVEALTEALRDLSWIFPTTGLAAPQLGFQDRVVVLKHLWRYIPMINPEIVDSSFPVLDLELCYSLPGVIAPKIRKLCVTVKYQSLDSQYHELKLRGFAAFTMQHEIDHLDGKLIID